jgi:hypothetical protein
VSTPVKQQRQVTGGATARTTTPADGVAARKRYHTLRVRRAIRETAQARSIVFDVPAQLSAVFAYELLTCQAEPVTASIEVIYE